MNEVKTTPRYTNTSSGVVKLLINENVIARKRFSGRKMRREIMTEWTRAFVGIETAGMVYIDVSYYENSNLFKDIQTEISLEKKVFVRPEATYSNPSYTS